MELWRIVAAVLLAAGGLTLVPLVMAKARESRGSDNTRVVVAGTISFLVTVLVVVATASVLPAPVAWALVAVVLLTVFVLLLAS